MIRPYFNADGTTIFRGDCLDVLRRLPDGVVQTCVTSPPYWGLRDYGVVGQLGLEHSPDCLGWATGRPCGECYVCRLVAVLREVRRVLRRDGTLWLNLGHTGLRRLLGQEVRPQALRKGSDGGRQHAAEQAQSRFLTLGDQAQGFDRHPLARRLGTAGGRLVSAERRDLGQDESVARKCARPADLLSRVPVPAISLAALLLRPGGHCRAVPERS